MDETPVLLQQGNSSLCVLFSILNILSLIDRRKFLQSNIDNDVSVFTKWMSERFPHVNLDTQGLLSKHIAEYIKYLKSINVISSFIFKNSKVTLKQLIYPSEERISNIPKHFIMYGYNTSQIKRTNISKIALKSKNPFDFVENECSRKWINFVLDEYIPSLSISSSYLRLHLENLQLMQNTHINALYQLMDPNVTLIYVTPFNLSTHQMTYHEKLLALLNISILPKRLTTITPEMSSMLPSHLSVAHQLYYSSQALNKNKIFCEKISK